jgi:hypothetical protein
VNNIVAALLLEREGYVARGRVDRVRMVDDVLRSLGYVVETTSLSVDVETTSRDKPRRRRKA